VIGIRERMMLTMTMNDAELDPLTPPPDTDEHTLIRAAVAGNLAAFEALYRCHVGRVHGVILRLLGSDRARAEDLTQDAFVRVWQRLAEFRFECAFSTWLHRLAVNVALMALRADRAERRGGAESGDDDLALPDHLARSPALGMDLEQLIAQLPPRARAVLCLHDIEGWQHDEIAQQLGMAVGTSKAQLHRARQLLKLGLGER